MGRGRDVDSFYSALSGLPDGGLADGIVASCWALPFWCFDVHSRAIVGSAKVGLVVDLWSGCYADPRILLFLDYMLRAVNAVQASLNDWLESGRRRPLYFIRKLCKTDEWSNLFPDESSEASIPSHAVVVSAVILLALVYHYLTGNVDIGSSKAYSRSSLDFRDIFVAVVLFLGAYVWIKFREVARPKGVHKRELKDKHGRLTKVVYEPRFKPPRDNGTVLQWVYLGQYSTPEEASILYQIAAFYYNDGQGGQLALGDGRLFSIPPMKEGEQSLTGAEKRAWVKVQVMKIYEDFKNEKAEAVLLQELLGPCEDQAMPRQGVVHTETGLLNSAEHQPPLLVSPAENSGMATAIQPMLDDEVLEWSSRSLGGMHEEYLENEVNVHFSIPSLSNSAEHQRPLLVSPAENSGMDMAMPADQGLGCASQSVGGMHESLSLSNGQSLGFQEGFTVPVSPLPPITESGMRLNGTDQWELHYTLTSEASLLNSAEHQLPLLVSQAENSRMDVARPGDQGLGCASQSFGGMHQGFATFNGYSAGLQEESARPVSQPTPDTQRGMDMNNSNQLNLPQIVHNQQELITYLRQQLQERDAHISVLQNEKRHDRLRISELESQHSVQQQMQVINQGVPSFDMEMEQSMPPQNHPCRPHGSAFW